MEKIYFDDLIKRTEEFYIERGRVLLALDGRCASGKSTAAERLCDSLRASEALAPYDCQIALLHMDDFFLRPEQRTPERLRIPGENVDHERFLEEVLQPLSQGQRCVYRPYDCHTESLREPRTISYADIAVIEGAYSCHERLRNYYDLRLLMDITPEEQRRRILQRNGEAGWQRFSELWIPLEERYFAALDGDVFDYLLR